MKENFGPELRCCIFDEHADSRIPTQPVIDPLASLSQIADYTSQRKLIAKAGVVTIATSPYFFKDQNEAINIVKDLLS